MRGSYVKNFISSVAIVFGLAIGILAQPVTAHAAGSVELYVDGKLTGTYDDIMSAFAQMTDASESYTVSLTENMDSHVYRITEDYTWPAVEQITLYATTGDSYAAVALKGENVLQGDLELHGVVIQSDAEGAAPTEIPEFSINIGANTLYIDDAAYIDGEEAVIDLQTGEYITEIIGQVVGSEGSRMVIDGSIELFCDLTVDKMILDGGVDFRGGKSQVLINELECTHFSSIRINPLFFGEQLSGAVDVSIGSCFLECLQTSSRSQLFDIQATGTVLEIGDIVTDHESEFELGFNLGDLYNVVENVEISITGTIENISGFYVQYNQRISTYEAYAEEFAIDKLLTIPNYAGGVIGYFHGFCEDIQEWAYGDFDVKKVGDSYYVDRDSIYLEKPAEEEVDKEITSGDWLYWLEDGCATIVGYIGVGEEIVRIPETLDGYPVTKIMQLGQTLYDEEGYRFSCLQGVKEIIIPETVMDLRPNAFMIHDLFGDISVLEKITVAEGNTEYKSVDGLVYSADGESLEVVPQGRESISIVEGTKYITEYAFYSNYRLKKLYMPDSIEYISVGGLRELDGLVELRLSQNMEDIASNVGVGCDSLKRLYVPALQKCTMACADSHGFGSDIFYWCENLSEVVFLDDEIKLWEGCTEIFGSCAPGFTAYCKAGSVTESVLKELGFKTKPLEELQPLRIYDENISMEVGEEHQNYLLRNPYDAAYWESAIAWESSNPAVVTVDADGLIVAMGVGETTISATCNGETVSTTVTVSEKTPGVPDEPEDSEEPDDSEGGGTSGNPEGPSGSGGAGQPEDDTTRQVHEFVERMYEVALDREADEEGLNNWMNDLLSGNKTGAEVAYCFIFSPEFKEKNYCNEHYIMQLYKAFMGREYEEEGLNYWLYLLKTGSTREAVFNGFSQSNEFKGICESYGIELGDPIENPQYGTVPMGSCSVDGKEDGVTSFVKRLYNICLDREAEDDGLDYWTEKLWSHECSGMTAAFGFVFSPEFMNRNHGDADYVEYLYEAFMGRSSDVDGKAYWLGRIANEGLTREDVFNGFAYSPEFTGICNGYGIVAY